MFKTLKKIISDDDFQTIAIVAVLAWAVLSIVRNGIVLDLFGRLF